ncbi:MAG: bifunctional indole-3-glycerol phosphate synthase/phosphoribosylanthranilate isomerase [Spirochaetota bacterium]
MENILRQIVEQRRARLAQMGPELGAKVPAERTVPVVKFGRSPFVITEIKRSSPSRGKIDSIFDPVKQARMYQKAGIRTVSILTEEEHFSGSLDDLLAVKSAVPALALLRKDFLLSLADIEVSYRAGADAVLLIARILEKEQLEGLYRRTLELGMTPLVELHSSTDLRKAERLQPAFVGINSRDLSTFRVDPAHPIKLKGLMSWPAAVVYESGIRGRESAMLPGRSGFAGILVGETAVREPAQIPELIRGFETGRAKHTGCPAEDRPRSGYFWSDLFRRQPGGGPYVKICGLTRTEDVRAADAAGADLLGFILAEVSPRATSAEFIRSLGATRALKVAVVLGTDSPVMPAVRQMLQDGELDAVQFHGSEAPEACAAAAYPYYKALPLREMTDIDRVGDYHCPRVLVDAYHQGQSGGTGKRIDGALVQAAAERAPLWLAGGLNPDNIAEVVQQYRPELLDASSGLETAPGIKDSELIARFIHNVRTANQAAEMELTL